VEELFLPAIECTWVEDVRQREIQTVEPLVPEPSAFEVELATEKLKVTYHMVLIKFPQN